MNELKYNLENFEMHKTNDYSLFKSVIGNRPICRINFRNLVKSISKDNLLPLNPIIVNQNMQIIDGQHRLEVAKHLEIPIYYMIINNTGLKQIYSLNAAQKKWSYMDYIISYSVQGLKDYTRLLEFIKEYKLPLSHSFAYLDIIQDSKTTIQKIIEGKLSISEDDIKNAEINLSNFLAIEKYFESINIKLIKAFIKITKHKGFSLNRLKSKLKQKPELAKCYSNYQQNLRMFEDVYNFKTQEKNTMRFF